VTGSEQASCTVDIERFNLETLNEGDVKKHYDVTIRNKFAVLENLGHWGQQHGMGQY
jgi:hypothetical protein